MASNYNPYPVNHKGIHYNENDDHELIIPYYSMRAIETDGINNAVAYSLVTNPIRKLPYSDEVLNNFLFLNSWSVDERAPNWGIFEFILGNTSSRYTPANQNNDDREVHGLNEGHAIYIDSIKSFADLGQSEFSVYHSIPTLLVYETPNMENISKLQTVVRFHYMETFEDWMEFILKQI